MTYGYNSDNDEQVKFDDLILTCPHCGGCNMHHTIVEVFNRAEDSKIGQHVEVRSSEANGFGFSWEDNDDVVLVDSDLSRNPSKRRQGILIDFGCENCRKVSILGIAQHKGLTYMYWAGD